MKKDGNHYYNWCDSKYSLMEEEQKLKTCSCKLQWKNDEKSLELEKYSNEILTIVFFCLILCFLVSFFYLQSMLDSTLAEELEAEANINKSGFIWEKCRTAYLGKTIQTTRIQCTTTHTANGRVRSVEGNNMLDGNL